MAERNSSADAAPPPIPARPATLTPPVMARPVAHALDYGNPWPAPPRPVNPLTLPTLSPRDATLDLLLVLLAMIFAPLLPHLLMVFMGSEQELAMLDWTAVAAKAAAAGLSLYLLVYFCLRQNITFASFGLTAERLPVQFGWGLATLVLAYIYLLGVGIVVLLLYPVLPNLGNDLERRVEFLKAMPVLDTLLSVVLLIFVAIHEEVIFRGLLLPYLRRVTGAWWPAVLISSVIFGLLHVTQGWLGVIQITGLGVLLSLVFILSRSLLAVTLAHFAFNFVQFQIARLLPDLEHLLKRTTEVA